jgi:transcriptional regulator with XRE-family HTH domain
MTGQALEKVRKGHGVSQLKAAELFGLSQPMLSHMETGRRNVSPEVARRAVELLARTLPPCRAALSRGTRKMLLPPSLVPWAIPALLISLVNCEIQPSSCSTHWIDRTLMSARLRAFLG